MSNVKITEIPSVEPSAQGSVVVTQEISGRESVRRASITDLADLVRDVAGLEVDATLTQQGAPADAKKTGDEITALKGDLSDSQGNMIPLSGLQNKLNDIVDATCVIAGSYNIDASPDWTSGYVYANGNIVGSSGYSYSQKVPVNAGDIINIIRGSEGTVAGMRTLTAYNGDTAVADKGSDSSISTYTVPDGINYVRVTISNAPTYFVRVTHSILNQRTDKTLAEENVAADAKTTGDEINEINRAIESLGDVTIGKINIDASPDWTPGYVYANGNIISSAGYSYSQKVPVNAGDIVNVINPANMAKVRTRTITAYIGDTALETKGSNDWTDGDYIVPDGVNYVRVTISNAPTYFVRVTHDSRIVKPKGTVLSSIGFNPFRYKPFMSHIYVGSTNPPIPNQSVYDIRNSKRLGFNVIEGNVQKTSDNKFICMHGNGGKFGNAVHHVDETTDISNITIGSVTLSWIQTNVRYNSIYEKYQTAPITLEDFLYACKINQMIPMITGTNQDVIAISNKIMGKDNYISYGGKREYTGAPILVYASATTKEEILTMCDTYGVPFIYSMGNPTAFTDEQLADIVNAVHEKGCWIGMASTYISAEETLRLLSLGFDMSASTLQVNDFDNGNIVNLYANIDFDQFDTTGTVSDNNLILQNGQRITTKYEIWNTMPIPFMSMSSLRFRANGAMTVTIGGRNVTITSDGTKWIWLSALYHAGYPNFVITSDGNTTIYSLEYHASRV